MGVVLPGLGPDDQAPLVNRQLDYTTANLTPDDYFVLTRIDGRTSLREIVLVSGFPTAKALSILQKLRTSGAIYFPGEVPLPPPTPTKRVATPAPPATMPPGTTGVGTAPPVKTPPTVPPARGSGQQTPPTPIVIDEGALAEEVELSVEQKRAILSKHASLRAGTLFDILEITLDADKKTIKRAYFRLSKEFHPDRFYGKKLGTFTQRLGEIFEQMTKAFDHLSDDVRRDQYLTDLSPGRAPATVPPGAPPAQAGNGNGPTPQARAHAADLFEIAVHHAVTGEHVQALKEFAAVIRLDPQARYLRRAAEAALRAQELRAAEEYAKKAAEIDPQNGSVRRMLGKVLRALGRLDEARRELELARRLDPENPHIVAELEELSRGR